LGRDWPDRGRTDTGHRARALWRAIALARALTNRGLANNVILLFVELRFFFDLLYLANQPGDLFGNRLTGRTSDPERFELDFAVLVDANLDFVLCHDPS
jgi:hypothetical protein